MNADEVKAMLRQYVYLKNEYEILSERYARLYQASHSPKKNIIEGMPGSTFTKDRIGDQLAKLEHMKKKLDTMQETIKEKKAFFEKNISRMTKTNEKELLLMRYIDGMSWISISEVLFGGEEDYTAAVETYLDRCYRIHRRALIHLAEVTQLQ